MEELPEEIRDQVLEKYRDWNVQDEWWDYTYEDAKRMGAMLGIEIAEIQFSGFCSQGDGASFTGKYVYEPEAVKKISGECTDPELIRIAEELTVLQATLKLTHGITYECVIQRPFRGVHSGCMQTNWDDNDYPEELGPLSKGFDVLLRFDEEVERLMRAFADWIYRQLQAESDYLESDEAIIESLKAHDLKFNLDGERI